MIGNKYLYIFAFPYNKIDFYIFLCICKGGYKNMLFMRFDYNVGIFLINLLHSINFQMVIALITI